MSCSDDYDVDDTGPAARSAPQSYQEQTRPY